MIRIVHNDCLTEFYCCFLDYYSCPPFLVQYVREVRTDWTLLHEVDEEIASINKEELFYQLAPTCYPEVEVIKASVQLHEKLFGFMLKWQRTQSRSVSP